MRSVHDLGRMAAVMAVALLVLLGHAGSAEAKPKRVAFIAGIARFDNLPSSKQLAKPLIDAATMKQVLRRLGFAERDIVHLEDPTQRQLLDGLDRFQRRLARGDLAFVFVSTHGVNFRGANYLLPRDIPKPETPINPAPEDIRGEEDRLARYAISEAEIRDRILRRRAEAAIIVLDACRDNPLRVAEADNPFKSLMPGDIVFGGAGLLETRGLGRSGATSAGQTRFFGLYSAGYGQRALDHLPGDATSTPSPFTRVLAEKLPRPGIGIMATATDVTREVNTLVEAKAKHWQTPATYNDLIGRDIVLVPGVVKPVQIAPAPTQPVAPTPLATVTRPAPSAMAAIEEQAREDAASETWGLIKKSREIAVLDRFIAAHGDTVSGAAARGRRRVLVDEAAMAAWGNLEGSEDEAAIARFISEHRGTPAAAPARVRLAALEKARGEREARAKRAAAQWRLISATQDVALVERFIATNPGTPAAATAEAHRKRLLDPVGALEPGSGKSARDRLKDGKDCPSCPEMVVVPSGEFRMGSPESEEGRVRDEGPVRTVRIGGPFAVGRTHVTRGEFAAFVRETGHRMVDGCYTWTGGLQLKPDASWQSPGFGQGDDHPVVCVGWGDAQAYVRWLGSRTGKVYRLLSEAEAEYAARGITRADAKHPRFWWGDGKKDLCRHANGADATAKSEIPGTSGWETVACRDGHAYTSPVGSFRANGFGLHDAAGNVWAWTEDCWNDSHADAPMDGSARTTGDCNRRVVRGGSWYIDPQYLRAALRSWYSPDYRFSYVGFRVARSLSR